MLIEKGSIYIYIYILYIPVPWRVWVLADPKLYIKGEPFHSLRFVSVAKAVLRSAAAVLLLERLVVDRPTVRNHTGRVESW